MLFKLENAKFIIQYYSLMKIKYGIDFIDTLIEFVEY
jgi:hypothetical protein